MLERERRQTENPVAYADLWHQDLPRTSQRRALQMADGTITALALFGGNGSGKSEVLGQLSVATAHGSNHPAARKWLARNHLSAAMLPPYPGRVLASALTSNDSRRVVREKVRKYLPAGCKWRNEQGDGEAEVKLPGGGVIVFKSNDQGRRAYQGDEYDLIALDEEHDQDVARECFMRLGRRRWRASWLFVEMTPLLGMTWMYDDFVASPRTGNRAAWIHGGDNPHADQTRRGQLLAQYGDHERAARDRGEFSALEGRVFGAWARHLHVVPAFMPPADWPRFGAIDFGTRNPAAWGLWAHDPGDDVLHLVAMHYARELTLSQHVAAWRALVADHPPVEWIVADPEDRSARLSMAREHDIGTVAATKDVRSGINAVAERLAPDVEGRPHLVVHDHPSLAPFLREIEGYVWKPIDGKRDGADAPAKRDDHAMDMARYLCMQVRRGQVTAV